MLLKFWLKNEDVVLDSQKAEMIDISSDLRTKLLNKDEMMMDKFKVQDTVYMLKKSFFISMAKCQNRESIEALLIKYKGNNIIIVGDTACVYFNGKAINVQEYSIDIDEGQGVEIASRIM